MVDASVGGKTGVDFQTLKNQIGLFKFPKQVIICPTFLQTLNKRQIKSGFAEVIKHALIKDKDYWRLLVNTDLDNIDWIEIISKSIKIKNNIVEVDPFENSQRKQLNFGHTIGHAIESYYLNNGNEILHGEAIGLGMIIEARMSNLKKEDFNQIKEFISKNIKLPKLPSFEKIEQWLIHDKKNSSSQIQFSLLIAIGKCKENISFKHQEIKKYFLL